MINRQHLDTYSDMNLYFRKNQEEELETENEQKREEEKQVGTYIGETELKTKLAGKAEKIE